MRTQRVRISPEFDFFFTFPYSLGFSLEYAPLPFSITNIDTIANYMNRQFPSYNWSMSEFDESLPLSLRSKGAFLVGEPKAKPNFQDRLDKVFNTQRIGVNFIELVEEKVVYFDHGVGSINLTIRGAMESKMAIPHLQQLAMAIIWEVRNSQGCLYVFDNWDAFRTAMRQCFEKANVLYDMWGLLSSGEYGREPTRYIGENAILRTQESDGFEVALEDIPELFAPFTGIEPEHQKNLLSLVDGITYLSEGWDGQIAILDDLNRERWLKDLWQFTTDYATALHDLDRYLHLKISTLRKETLSQTIRQYKQEMRSIKKIELSIALLTHETIPYNFGGINEEIQVYRGIYDSWEMKRISDSLYEKFIFLNNMYSKLSSEISTSLGLNMNKTMLIFTVLTLAGVLASIISTTDFDGDFLNSPIRLFIIIFGTLSAGLLALVSYLSGRKCD